MIEVIEHSGKVYPAFQASHNSARFIIPFAKEVCKGKGFDIGYSKREWQFPDSIGVDIDHDEPYHAMNLPENSGQLDGRVDYIFSSHCLEHISDWVRVLDYWTERLNVFGTLFLYLPDFSQTYWRPWHNQKHVNVLTREIIFEYLKDSGRYKNIFVSGCDLNNSFAVMAMKIK